MGRGRTDAIRALGCAVLGGLVTALALSLTGALGGAGGVAAAGAPSGERVRAVYAAAVPAVVTVAGEGRTGSGFLVDDAGHVVTNAHVVGDAERVEVTVGGRAVGARVRGAEPSVDVAVLTLDEPAGGAAPLAFGDSAALRVGDPVAAIGAPFGLPGSLTTGVVSGLRRQIEAPNGFAITGVIQTDAALNPGNSGGPLLDLSGRVVGMATQIATEAGRNEGVGFAVPADVVRRAAGRIIATGRASLPYLGVVGADAGDGVLVGAVLADGPAVGRLAVGDLIVAVEDAPVRDNAGLAAALAGRAPGETVSVRVRHEGGGETVEVTLAERPAGGPAAG